MSIVNPDIGKTLVHHSMTIDDALIHSRLVDYGIGLSWRNASTEHLLKTAAYWELKGGPFMPVARLLFNAAILKEDAIKNGINLEDKL
jgi:hypothetical protein